MQASSLDVQEREKKNYKKPNMDNKAREVEQVDRHTKKPKTPGNNGKGGGTKKEREKSKPKPDRKYQQRGPQQQEEED
ncbi:hypothetical protein M433DRAFT_10203 [Acidomyces richmondensis BFW]|nr:hypothetical protein M433DRAFT_10203 [Acidomyces richmondensis BFW]